MRNKNFVTTLVVLLLAVSLFAAGAFEASKAPSRYVASTSWTAAIAELAGVDGIVAIAPANLRHPPEYEIKASDIVTLMNADLFIYAGYERMMATMKDSVNLADDKQLKITTANDIANIQQQTQTIAALAGTQAQRDKRVGEYVAVIEAAKTAVQEKGLDTVPALVHAMQVPLAKDLGLNIQGTFGSAPATAAQIADAASGKYGIIIDNVHNPVAGPLMDVSPSSTLVVWRNFPEAIGNNALLTVVQDNIQLLLQ